MSTATFTAKSLEEIAGEFERKATVCATWEARARTLTERKVLHREAWTWREAADILRKTTLEEPKGEKP